MEEVVIGIDIGGTNTGFAYVNKKGEIKSSGSINTRDYQIFDDYLAALIFEIFRKNNNNYQIKGIGIGAPNGNYLTGNIENAVNLNWKGIVNITKKFKAITGYKIFLTNDANAAAIGEKLFGDAKKLTDFIVITLGTGLGCGIYCDGKLLYGSTGFAGELGHSVIDFNGRPCGCGRKGCLETYASATGIRKTALELLKNENNSLLKNYKENRIGAMLLEKLAFEGDELCKEAYRFTGEILGKALANTAAVLSPQVIFLTGGLAQAGDLIFKPTNKYFKENLLNCFKGKIKILPSGLKSNESALLGAAALCWDNIA